MYRTHYIIESLHWFTFFFSETTIFNGKKPWFPVSIFPTKPIQGFFDESQASHYGKMTINHKPSFDHGTYAAHIYIYIIICIYYHIYDPGNTENIGFDPKSNNNKQHQNEQKNKLENQKKNQGKNKKKNKKKTTHQQDKQEKQLRKMQVLIYFFLVLCFFW